MSIDVDTRWTLSEAVCRIAREAGERILTVYERDFAVENKADDTPLTEADSAAHDCIRAGLAALEPELPILSEEGAEIAFEERRDWRNYWLVDPLDGTKEFIKKNGEFTVNIALIEDRRPVLGVVHAPVLGTTYLGVKGKGAFRIDGDAERRAIHTRSVPEDGMTVVVSRSHRGDAVDALLERLPPHDTVSVGSSLKFCQVAEGKADLYPRFGPTSEWDTGAAQCVVETAGGRVTRIDGTPLAYNSKDSLLNPDFVVVGDPAHDWSRYLDGLTEESR